MVLSLAPCSSAATLPREGVLWPARIRHLHITHIGVRLRPESLETSVLTFPRSVLRLTYPPGRVGGLRIAAYVRDALVPRSGSELGMPCETLIVLRGE